MDVGNLLMKVSDNLSVRRAFGAAYEKDDMLIIPVAMVAGAGGGGTAHPRHRDPAAGPDSLPEAGPAGHDATPQDSGRMDAGGGFGGLVLPAGAYVVKGGQVRWVPAVDMTHGPDRGDATVGHDTLAGRPGGWQGRPPGGG